MDGAALFELVDLRGEIEIYSILLFALSMSQRKAELML